MTQPQIAVFAILACAFVLFAWGRLRHDLIAMAALLAGVLLDVVPGREAFSGFGHPAVVTVATVLMIRSTPA